MLRTLLLTSALILSIPAAAQSDYAAPVMITAEGTILTLADTPDIATALSAGGEPIVAKVLGAVCDFCATAMNKMFGRYDDVAAVYVDLDAKTLNLVLAPGATMDDDRIRKLVKKAGYKVDSIARSPDLPNAG